MLILALITAVALLMADASFVAIANGAIRARVRSRRNRRTRSSGMRWMAAA